jgi:hypothetical protein
MNKFLVTAAVLAVMTVPAMAHKAKIASTPTTPYFVGTGAVVKDGKVYVTAPYGSDVQVDVDGTDLDVTVTKPDSDSVWNTVLPWRWNIWR